MAATVAKTLHPLPFENLEPKRFEDLVRQLIYDFRQWTAIEATGRSGSDKGFDARGFERGAELSSEPGDEDLGEETVSEKATERIWLIQCKREKAIGPSAMRKHLEAIAPASIEQSYGLLFAAACDFSKATRDECREWCRQRGVQEVHVWGKAEIEDQLYQPKNDNLLFAYFGISLQVRKQSLTTRMRRTTTIKRKIQRHLSEDGWLGKPFILRDPTASHYPYTQGKKLGDGELGWLALHSRGVGVNGLRIVIRCHHGYLDYATGNWDIASAVDRSSPMETELIWDAWSHAEKEVSQAAISRWSELPPSRQAFLIFEASLPYDEILEVDEVGDDVCTLPTVFVQFNNGSPPIPSYCDIYWEASRSRQRMDWTRKGHVRLFGDEHKDLRWETGWAERNGVALSAEKFILPDTAE